MIRYICDNGELLISSDYFLREIALEPYYEVVNCKTEKLLKCSLNKDGYISIWPCFNGKRKTCQLHRLILSTFDPIGYFDGAQVNHIDEVKTNNKLSNLEWLSAKDNSNYATRNKRVAESIKGVFVNRKDQSKPVLQYTKSGSFVAEYPSTMEAMRQIGVAQSSICACCHGKRKSAGGFIWKWKS